jgi:hypothetical protein
MVLRVNTQPVIEDLRHHSAETVDKLRQLLATGAPAKADPHRNDFFEVENGSRVFYIHISPVSGKVMLLATWLKEAQPAPFVETHQAA